MHKSPFTLLGTLWHEALFLRLTTRDSSFFLLHLGESCKPGRYLALREVRVLLLVVPSPHSIDVFVVQVPFVLLKNSGLLVVLLLVVVYLTFKTEKEGSLQYQESVKQSLVGETGAVFGPEVNVPDSPIRNELTHPDTHMPFSHPPLTNSLNTAYPTGLLVICPGPQNLTLMYGSLMKCLVTSFRVEFVVRVTFSVPSSGTQRYK